MKLSQRFLKTAQTGYLYSDGHMAIVHSKPDEHAGQVEWVTLHSPEEVGIPVAMAETHRLIFNRYGLLPFLTLPLKSISVTIPSVEQGSHRTRALGLAVGSVKYGFPVGTMHIDVLPDVLSADVYPYPINGVCTYAESAEKHCWGGHSISREYR